MRQKFYRDKKSHKDRNKVLIPGGQVKIAKQAVLLTLDYFTFSFTLKMPCERDADLKKLCLCLPFVKR